MSSSNPSTNSSTTNSNSNSTTTTTTITEQNHNNNCLVYWDDQEQIIKKLGRNTNNQKRNSSTAGIPSPTKSTITSLKLLNNNNHTSNSLRFSKRTKNLKSISSKDQLLTTSTVPLLPKKKAWEQLAHKLSNRTIDQHLTAQTTPRVSDHNSKSNITCSPSTPNTSILINPKNLKATEKAKEKAKEDEEEVIIDPWEIGDDDEFGSQLLELADLVEKEQNSNCNNSISKKEDAQTTAKGKETAWKLVELKKGPTPPPIGLQQKQPTRLAPSKAGSSKQDRNVVQLKQSPIIYKSVSKVGVPCLTTTTTGTNNYSKKTDTQKINNHWSTITAPTIARNTTASKISNHGSKISYSEIVKNPSKPIKPTSINPCLKNTNEKKNTDQKEVINLDLGDLFNGIDGNDLDWDPDDL
ncbi:hypothetical protein H4Q26_013569 [Puccinia striiformis f. sp. tritici PST-130]|uniref:Uncharacterized protein n=1 Tax=Puccinia striiformis f. sp. tritici PST-78 TaxID=1165861 RepID=A0A0L0VN54_9BASI|nr:hypothetical protein Pst134EB_025304 [Puccinia striiformis f. sp. tritici]KAI9620894.1 hypothetical protein H4Q26_013569 [Puccinia striiformis f. sp. tritici PST-130]KNF00445.1 hypothetical protein PSTG_06373 [Puccinia striiformis f. sp. tritici PST-78]